MIHCTWTETKPEVSYWATQCDHAFTINDGTPADNGMRFCCYCGNLIKQVPFSAEEESE